jgi:HEAT repeat protein
MGFKEDADFARYVSMGAVAANAVRADLKLHGHDAIELERFAMSNKVWQTKVKRMRLPDLVCTKCGLRIESRGKSQLGIIVSHSQTDNRGWEGGMRGRDLFAFLRVSAAEGAHYASAPVYFRMRDMGATLADTNEGIRKAASDGSEITLIWKSWVPRRSGVLVGTDTDGRLICKWDDGTSYAYWQWRNWPSRQAYIRPGDRIIADETMVAGIVDPPETLECAGGWDLHAAISDPDPGERYAAVKAAGVLNRSDLIAEITHITRDEDDWRLRLEAAASLARLDPERVSPIIAAAADPANSDAQRIEAVFVLSEIPTEEAAEALAEIAAEDRAPQELRAAAVWNLARGVHPRPDLVLPYIADADDLVALHAIAGLPDLPEFLVPELIRWLSDDNRHAAAAAQVLLRHTAVQPLLTAVHNGGHGRLWALRALGDLHPALVRERGGHLLTEDVERYLEPVWIGREDWLRTSGADGLDALDVQKVRFNPLID